MSIRAVLFDLDGTLLDTLDDIADAMNEVLDANGFPTHPLDPYRHFVGDGVRMLATRTLPEDHRDEATITRCTAELRQAYARHWNVKTAPYPGIDNMLDGVVARGLKVAILSNKPDDFTRRCVAEFLPRWRFDGVMGHHAGIALKPDPAGALEMARRLGVDPHEILYVGDSGMDMETATRAGMVPLGVLWGFRSRAELEASGAVGVVARPDEILAFLDAPAP